VPTRSRGQRRAAPPSSGPFVHDWLAPATVGWLAQARCAQNRADTFVLPLLARVPRFSNARTRKWVCVARQASAERKPIGATISDMHDRGLGGKASQARDQAHPDIGLSFSSLSSLASRFCCWGSCAYKRLLHRASQHLPTLRQDGQHRLQIQPSSSLEALLAQALRFGMMAQVHFGGVRNPQHEGSPLNLFAGLVPMRLHQCENSSHRLHPSLRYKALVSFQVCIWAGKDAEAFLAMRVAAFTARAVRRISAAACWVQRSFSPSILRSEVLTCSSSYFSSLLNVYKRQRLSWGLLRGASPECSVRARDSVSRACNPSCRMFFAALWSRSREQPQEQECQRSSNSFWTIAPQPLHIWLVYLGGTARLSHPVWALAACSYSRELTFQIQWSGTV